MKVAITRPKYRTHLITPPLGIGYLSSFLKNKGIECLIIDGLNKNLSNDEIVLLVGDCEVVGISVFSSYFMEAIDLTKRLKKAGKIVVVGGPQASALPELTLQKTGADYVVVGEGEEIFYKLIRQLSLNKKATKKKRILFSTFNKQLSSLPIPDWDQIDPRLYQMAPHGGFVSSFPVAPVITTRGCPYDCKFCASPRLWGKMIRFRDPKEVVDEVEYLVRKKGVKEIHFEDDNFTLDKKHTVKICREIIRRKLNIDWCTPNGIRADKVDFELLKLMKRSGCYSVAFGIESGDENILKNISKHESLEIIKKALYMSKKAGLLTQGFFIFGLPGETEDTIRKTIDFAMNMPIDKAQFLMLDVIPGSELWEQLNFDKRVNWQLNSFHEISWLPPTIERKVLNNALKKAFFEFYLRPRQIWLFIKYFRISQLQFLLRRISDFKIFSV